MNGKSQKIASKMGSKLSNWRQKHKISEWRRMWSCCDSWKQKTKSQQRMKERPWLIDVLFWSSSWQAVLLYITELCGVGHDKAAFSVRARNKIQRDTGAGWHRPQYPRFMTEHTTSAAISGTDSVSKPLAVSRLVAMGHIDLYMPAYDQTDCIKINHR